MNNKTEKNVVVTIDYNKNNNYIQTTVLINNQIIKFRSDDFQLDFNLAMEFCENLDDMDTFTLSSSVDEFISYRPNYMIIENENIMLYRLYHV